MAGLLFDLRAILSDPVGTAAVLLEAGIEGLVDVEVRSTRRDLLVQRITLEPWASLADHDYPTEQVSVMIWADGRILAVPLEPDRPWLHLVHDDLPNLCLWFPDDPVALRWTWEDGLACYVAIVHRHLLAEECWRRRGEWPGEDAPHGLGEHPISSIMLRRAASLEAFGC